MNVVYFQALTIASGGILSVGSILIVLVLLSSQKGLVNGFAYVSGYFINYLFIGFLAILFDRALDSIVIPDIIPHVILMVLGVLFLSIAAGQVRNIKKPSGPKWLNKIDNLPPSKAFRFGALVAVINFKNLSIYLSAIAVLLTGRLTLRENSIGILLVALLFCSSVFLPVILRVLLRKKSEKWLSYLRHWLQKYGVHIGIIILLLFGSLFFIKGLIKIIHIL